MPLIRRYCDLDGDKLPGLGPAPVFTGGEYRAPGTPPDEFELSAALTGYDPEKRAAAADYVFEHPDAVEPFNLIYAITDHIVRGDRERALFWFFIWQTRTRPYIQAVPEFGIVRGAMNATIREELLTWAGSDVEASREVWLRAIRYELKAPLYQTPPEGVSNDDWAQMIAAAREENSEASVRQLHDENPPEEVVKERRENGLYVGPWIEPGRPLKDEWR